MAFLQGENERAIQYYEAMKNIKEALELYLEPDEDELFDFQGAQIAEVAI
jgi:predicted RNase H-like HicB family nuclease